MTGNKTSGFLFFPIYFYIKVCYRYYSQFDHKTMTGGLIVERIKIFVNGEELKDEIREDATAHHIECWYDSHYRHWVLYPVDAEGNQLEEATYAFGKKNALELKAEMEERMVGQQIYNAYVQVRRQHNG